MKRSSLSGLWVGVLFYALFASSAVIAGEAEDVVEEVEAARSTQAPAADPDVVEPPSSSSRILNLQASPIGLWAKRYNGSVELGITEAFSIGPKVTLMRNSFNGGYLLSEETGSEIGVRGTYAFSGRRFSSGVFLRGGLLSASFQRGDMRTIFESFLDPDNERTMVEIKGPKTEALIGYQYFTGTGFNCDIAAGLDLYFSKEKRIRARDGAVVESSLSSVQRRLSVEGNFGFAF